MSDTKPAVIRGNAATEFFISEQCHITELSNGPTDEVLSVAMVRVEPGVTTRWHRLEAITERYCILQGHGRVEIGDLPATEVRPGDVVLIPPGCRQRICNSGSEELKFLALCTPRFRPAAYKEIS